jgi:hypothetical protein
VGRAPDDGRFADRPLPVVGAFGMKAPAGRYLGMDGNEGR